MHSFSNIVRWIWLALAAAALAGRARAAEPEPPRGVALLPQGIASFGAAADGGWLYVYGGHVGRTHEHSLDNLSSSFRRLNLLDRATWEELPGGPPLQGLALATHRGALYRVGGLAARNRRGEPEDLSSVAEVARYEPVERAWSSLPPLPEPRSSHDAVILGDVLIVVGGWSIQGPAKSWHRGGWKLDLAAAERKWEPIPGPPTTRRALAAAGAGGHLVAIGGLTESAGATRAVEILDLAAGEWSRGPDYPGAGFGVAAAWIAGRLVASGGDGKVHALSADRSRWEAIGTLALPRVFHRMLAAADDEAIVLGGATRESHLRVTESLRFGALGVTGSTIELVLPFPGRAKSRAGIFLVGDYLHFAGGNASLEQHDFDSEDFVAESYRVHLGALAIERRASLPGPRQSMAATGTDDATPLLLGGFGHDGKAERSHAEVYGYDVKADAWHVLDARLPVPRTQLGAAEHGGKVWVLGGLDYDGRREGDAFRLPLEIVTLDRQAGAAFATVAAVLPRPRRAFAGAQLGARYYLVGGFRERFQPVEECDMLDLDSGRWEQIPAPARVRVSGDLVALGGKLYLAGGSSPKASGGGIEPNHTMERYDPATRAWVTVLERLPLDPAHVRMLPWRDRLVLVSTYHRREAALRIVILDPAADAAPRAEL